MSGKLYRLTKSKIHNVGVVAARGIPKGTRIVEYAGERISRQEGDRRSEEQVMAHTSNPQIGEVYIFELDDEWDVDGSVDYNDAKFINHSCDPNCESEIKDGHVWIVALRDIKAGEELTYDYFYDLDEFEKYPCRCGSQNCFGFILEKGLWEKGRAVLAQKAKKEL